MKLYKAIKKIQDHLDKEYIIEECYRSHGFGCPSCRAINLKKELELLWECDQTDFEEQNQWCRK